MQNAVRQAAYKLREHHVTNCADFGRLNKIGLRKKVLATSYSK
jgi:hypothetical protein